MNPNTFLPARLLVTGTDTDVGKTHVSCALLRQLVASGRRCSAIKPIASGCLPDAQGRLQSADALALTEAANVKMPYELCNPLALAPPISPHLAMRASGLSAKADDFAPAIAWAENNSDFVLIEGAGGWLSPLADGLDHADLAQRFDLPVLLVVGMRLGCINHARLSARAIVDSGCRLLGWIASVLPAPMLAHEENLDTLRALLPAPLLASVSGSRFVDHGWLRVGSASGAQSLKKATTRQRLN